MSRIFIVFLLTISLGSSIPGAENTFPGARRILEQNCLECHHEQEGKGGLKLHTSQDFLLGGDEELAFNKQSPKQSELLRRILLAPGHQEFMPPSSKKISREPLNIDEIQTLEKWLLAGAPWPKGITLEPKEKTAPWEDPQKPDPNLVNIEVFPSQISLETASDFHRLVILANSKNATTRDVSASAKITILKPELASLKGTTVRPLADGETKIRIHFRGQKKEIPLTIKDATQERPISFQQDIVPTLTAAGCNTGSCHGSARGQDGFMLSLFGYDPKGDHHRITRQQLGRRINLALPEESLLLTKATGTVPHTGGKIFDQQHPYYNTILRWLQDGAHYDPDNIALPTNITVEPAAAVLKGPHQRLQLTVRAEYSDGTDRDVTSLSSFTSSNDSSVQVNPNKGQALSTRQGEAFLMARFHTFTQGSQNIVVPSKSNYRQPSLKPHNYIDEHVHTKLHKLHLIPSALCSDESFLRRIHLDLIGLLPTPEEREKFIADTNPNKRSQLIAQLIERKEFNEIWVMKWAELLQIRSTGNNAKQITFKAAKKWHQWLHNKVTSDTPFDQIVREQIASSGGTLNTPQTNYYKLERDIKKITENVAQVFLGTRIQCAQCHNHPFDRWTMNDYYGFANFFSQVRRKEGEDPHEHIISDNAQGEINHPVTKKSIPPTFLGGDTIETDKLSRRETLAQWLTSKDNPWFANNIANIVWAHFFGIGIVEPVDDARISNPPSNPELFNALGEQLKDYDFNIKKLVRDICNSRTYQLSTQSNETNALDETNFSKSRIRRLRAEILLDIISQVTNTPNQFHGMPKDSRAVQIEDGRITNYFLTTFGRATRTTVCSCEVKMEPNLSQALHLLNGESTHDRIYRGKLIEKIEQQHGPNPKKIITELYLRTLTREPTPSELQHLLTNHRETPEEIASEFYPDLFWALLNSKEFIFNH